VKADRDTMEKKGERMNTPKCREWRPKCLPGLFGFVAVLMTTSVPAQAQRASDAEAQIARCIHQVAGDKPWLEKTLWGLRDQEGGWIGAEVRNTNGSHDLGPLQINSWWVPRLSALLDRSEADIRIWLKFDPCFNADAARWIFLSTLRSTGSYWKAVGAYHSPARWRQKHYASSVAGHLVRRFGAGLFVATTPRDAPEQNVALLTVAHGTAPANGSGFGVVRILDDARLRSGEEGR
jgi:hypothetical protein